MPGHLTREAVEKIAAATGEPGWLTERRTQAFDIFEKLEDPDPKGEEWRYVDVRGFDFSRFEAPIARTGAPEVPAGLAEKGVIFTDFATAARDYPDLLREHFFTE